MTETTNARSYTSNPVAETMKVELARDRDERVSLAGVSPEEALKALLQTPRQD
jgi:hypothetical protein